jgi:hypothetical protein
MNHVIFNQTNTIVIVKRWYQSIVSTTKFIWSIHTSTDSSTLAFTSPAIWSAALTLQSKAAHETSNTNRRGKGESAYDLLWWSVTGSAKQNTTLWRYVGGIMVHAYHMNGQFRAPKAFVPKENSHGPYVLPEYNVKKNPNPTPIGPWTSGPVGCAWQVLG